MDNISIDRNELYSYKINVKKIKESIIIDTLDIKKKIENVNGWRGDDYVDMVNKFNYIISNINYAICQLESLENICEKIENLIDAYGKL